MNFKSLSNQDLDQNLKRLVTREREVLSQILLHIEEVDRRKAYLEVGHPNLFSYLTQHIGYSNGSAQRRIDAARLAKEIPSLVHELEQGNIHLSQVTLLQKSLRQAAIKFSLEEKAALLGSLRNQSLETSQVLVSQALGVELKSEPKIQFQADQSVRLEMTFTPQQWEKLDRSRALLSHAIPDGSWNRYFEYLAERVIQTKSPSKRSHSDRQSFYQLRKMVFARDQVCQHRSSEGHLCGSRWFLQVDHIRPKWDGGLDSLENLRLLCGKHNRHRYEKQAGVQVRR